jgi:hypothetical protein
LAQKYRGRPLAFYNEEIRNWVRRHLLSGPCFVCTSGAIVLMAEVLYRVDMVLLWGVVPRMVAVVIAAAIERNDRILNVGHWHGRDC